MVQIICDFEVSSSISARKHRGYGESLAASHSATQAFLWKIFLPEKKILTLKAAFVNNQIKCSVILNNIMSRS